MRLAVLVSGRGTNLLNIIKRHEDGFLKSEVALVVSDHECDAIESSKRAGFHTIVLNPKSFVDDIEYGERILGYLKDHRVDLVVLAGFLKKIPENVIRAFNGRIINIHPALLPSFGGKGMYGIKVHQAVIDQGCKVSGATVHIVDLEYDHGPIILQKCVRVDECDSADSLANKIHQLEYELLPEAIKLFEDHRINVEGRRVLITREGSVSN